MIRVLLVDDHVLVRAGLREILKSAPDIEVVGEASSGEEAVALTKKLNPDVVVMDISMPGIGGLEATKRITERDPAPAVLVLTVHPEERFGLRLLRAGALGYLEKTAAPDELVAAVRRVYNRMYYLSPKLEQRVIQQHLKKTLNSEAEQLTDRELEVLVLIASGKTPREVAEELCLSRKTVDTYRARIRKKLGLRTPVEYLRFARDHQLLGEP